MLGGITRDSILQAVNMAVGMAECGEFGEDVLDYTAGNVSSIVLRLIQSYVPIINDKVWRKNG